jgi:hypothetical protein
VKKIIEINVIKLHLIPRLQKHENNSLVVFVIRGYAEKILLMRKSHYGLLLFYEILIKNRVFMAGFVRV